MNPRSFCFVFVLSACVLLSVTLSGYAGSFRFQINGGEIHFEMDKR